MFDGLQLQLFGDHPVRRTVLDLGKDLEFAVAQTDIDRSNLLLLNRREKACGELRRNERRLVPEDRPYRGLQLARADPLQDVAVRACVQRGNADLGVIAGGEYDVVNSGNSMQSCFSVSRPSPGMPRSRIIIFGRWDLVISKASVEDAPSATTLKRGSARNTEADPRR